ncbi:MAG: SUMF1/EgtB/PvdO family nonheme iron enzyme [Gemmataceae bacterium]
MFWNRPAADGFASGLDATAALLAALHADPTDETAWLALADCLEERGETDRAELLRATRHLNGPASGRQRAVWQRRVQGLLTAGVRPCVPTLTFALRKTVSLTVALMPPGSFRMGCGRGEQGRDSDERPRHRVTLTQPFYLSVTPVTQAQWRAVTRRSPSYFKGAGRPVERVNFNDCQAFCDQLAARIGRPVRLPTEAEWEYACRAGTTTAYAGGNDPTAMDRLGWYGRTATEPVALKEPNPWGLYDLHGNVWEWTRDAYGPYSADDQTDPCAAGEEHLRVARGGSYSNPAAVCRSACRIGFMAGGRNDFIGCRVVIEWSRQMQNAECRMQNEE